MKPAATSRERSVRRRDPAIIRPALPSIPSLLPLPHERGKNCSTSKDVTWAS